jgi:hypothetical protein
MKQFDNLVDALKDLLSRGYTIDFNIRENAVVCGEAGVSLEPHEFEIDEVYRFEGMNNDPGDSTILYAISSHHGHKGVLVNAYGAYEDGVSSEIVAKLYSHIV